MMESSIKRGEGLGPKVATISIESIDGFDSADPWLMMEGPIYRATPKRFLEQVGYIRKASEWRSLGFAVQIHGANVRPIMASGLSFGFRNIGRWARPHHLEALRKGKRALHTYVDIDAFLMLGGRREELLDLPEDIWAYHRAAEAERAGNMVDAIAQITSAVHLDPEQVRYRERLYDWRIRAGDNSAVGEFMEFFDNDLDSVVHSGLALAALKLLRSQDSAAAELLYQRLQVGLARMQSCPVPGRYSSQSGDFIAAKAEALARDWQKVLSARPKKKASRAS